MMDICLKTPATEYPMPRFATSGSVEQNAAIAAALRLHAHEFRAGALLELEGERNSNVFIVLKGWVSVSKGFEDGETPIIDFGLPEDVFDLSSADGKSAIATLQALTDATVAVIPVPDWEKLMSAQPGGLEITTLIMNAAKSRIVERMARLGRGSAQTRIAYALLELCTRLRAVSEIKDCHFHIPLTQQQLGEFLGISSVHVCRTLRRLVRAETVQMSSQIEFHILDVDALSDMAGIDPQQLEREIIPKY